MTDSGEAIVGVLADALNTDREILTRETELGSLETWDSMVALEVLIQLESELGVHMNLQNYNELRTVGQLIDLVEAELTRQ